jgi:hypothetical protein
MIERLAQLTAALNAIPKRRELLWFAAFGGFGLLVLPFLIYALGSRTLGPYEGGGLGSFLATLYGDFLRFRLPAWCLLLGPYLLALALRLLVRALRGRAQPESALPPPGPPA